MFDRILDMVYKLNGRKNVYIQKCNNITNNSNKRIIQSLQVPKIKYGGYQIKRKSSVSKINVARSNTNFYYEP